MTFDDIPADMMTLRIKPSAPPSIPLEEQEAVLFISSCPVKPGEFEIRLKTTVLSVVPVIDKDIRRLDSELAAGRSFVARLANWAADGSVELRIAFFTGDCLEMGDVQIGVDEKIAASVSRMERIDKNNIPQHLDQKCCLKHGDAMYFFFTAGPALHDGPALRDGVPPEEEAENSDGVEKEPPESETPPTASENSVPPPERVRKNSFRIVGDGISVIATEQPAMDGQSFYLAMGATKAKANAGRDRALRLARGRLRFVDWTGARRISSLAQAQLAALMKSDGSYLKKWDEFGDLEGEILLKQARELGCLPYCDIVHRLGGATFVRLTQVSKSAETALEREQVEGVQFVSKVPAYVSNPTMSFAEFVGEIEELSRSEPETDPETDSGSEPDSDLALEEPNREQKSKNSQRKRRNTYKISSYDRVSQKLELLDADDLSKSGFLIMSLQGEMTQIKRRMEARRMILEGRSVNPQLGLLIEENGQIAPTRQSHRIKPLTAFVRNKVFRNPPTLKQEEAIDVALNTPDIALIQGPPGTGKTTVIAAILERLHELADKRRREFKGMAFLTGFQHDAVENMIDRISLNGLPIPKFGKRSGASEDDFDRFEKKLYDWCAEIAAELRKRNPRIAESERETAIKDMCLQYIQVPGRQLAGRLVEGIRNLGVDILGEDVARRADTLLKKLGNTEIADGRPDFLLNAVRSLRIRPESFSDDGEERAGDVLDVLDDSDVVLDDGDRDLLNRAGLWKADDGVPPFLKELASLKKRLLIRFTAPPVFRVEKRSDEVMALADEAVQRIRNVGFSAKDTKTAALAEFLAELESNPLGMIDAVSEYSFAFAATCQQSVNREMQKQKGVSDEQRLEYEYVIVDEAARVSPRDLMIPLARGKRIILVGDHRQLPHIIDNEVASQMEEGKKGATENDELDWLKKSMFQYLFSERLKTLEKADGITRRVTLDKQYRMHPLLGGFVSRNFYERFDNSEKFTSGRPASDFAHDLPGTNGKPAVWLDVPRGMGEQQRSKTSWTRPIEASVIADKLREWMGSKAGEDLTFGVISFYKAQAELIKRQLAALDIDDKKLRIGTVDSFQGMEFDVVFLSMVRTALMNRTQVDEEPERTARRLFGHLCLYNRLNVSMSRQKKLLVMVGDSGMTQSALAAEYIPGVVDFFRLCREEGTVLPCHG